MNPKSNKLVVAGIFILIALLTIAEILSLSMYAHAGKNLVEFEHSVFISRLFFWLILLIMFIYASKIEKQSLWLYEGIKRSFIFYILSVLAVFIIALILVSLLSVLTKAAGLNQPQSYNYTLLIQTLSSNKLLLVFTTLTAGIVEELLFRGYLLSRLQLFFKNSYVPVIISSVVFGLFHIGYGTILNVIGPILLGVLFALYYNRYKNIVPVIIAHFLYDLVLILISVYTIHPAK